MLQLLLKPVAKALSEERAFLGEENEAKKKQPKTRRKNIKPTARDSGMEIIIVWGHPLAGGKISMKGS